MPTVVGQKPSSSAQQPEDIPDPPVPVAVVAVLQEPSAGQPPASEGTGAPHAAHEALLHGFCQALQSQINKWLTQTLLDTAKHEEKREEFLKEWIQKTHIAWIDHLSRVTQQNEHAQYQLSEVLGLNGPPYQATVQAHSPDGYPVTLTVTKRDTNSLMEDVGKLLPWLKAQGYQA
jgi:hypothetical protein